MQPQKQPFPHLQPIQIMNGLASADRALLATALALFEDSTLSKRLSQLYDAAANKVMELTGQEIASSTASVQLGMESWLKSKKSDDYLRLLLWIYIREALDVPARLSVSHRGIELLADDVTAAAIRVVDPADGLFDQGKKWLGLADEEERVAVTLSDIVNPVLEELMKAALDVGDSPANKKAQAELLERTRVKLSEMTEADQQSLLDAVGAEEMNDEAIRNILLTGGGLAAFGTSVSIAGFSAYILAAQASAFIPFVSGAGLVSLVSVISNPITVVAATGAAAWWFSESANQQVQAAVAVRILALLALQGASNSDGKHSSLTSAFSCVEQLKASDHLSDEVIGNYQEEWDLLAPAIKKPLQDPDPRILQLIIQPAFLQEETRNELVAKLFPEEKEEENAVVFAAMTLGEMLYSAAAINPLVINAADFSRAEDLSGFFDFSVFAESVDEMSVEAARGALSNLKGYVAEQMVAAELVGRGYVVDFPATSNQAGYDLLVDGVPMQVKFHESLEGLRNHFERYEYPVYANAELADQIPAEWADKVFFIDGLTEDFVENITSDSLAAGADMLNPQIPVFALAITAGRSLMQLHAGEISHVQAVEQILMDGTVRVGLAVAGNVAGSAIGLLLFGPAGAWVLGAGLPVLSQAHTSSATDLIRDAITTEADEKWKQDSHAAIDNLHQRLLDGLDLKREQLIEKYKAIDVSPLGKYIRWRIANDGIFLNECRLRLQKLGAADIDRPEQRISATARWLATATLHPAHFQEELAEVTAVLSTKPSLLDEGLTQAGELWDSVTDALSSFFFESVKPANKN